MRWQPGPERLRQAEAAPRIPAGAAVGVGCNGPCPCGIERKYEVAAKPSALPGIVLSSPPSSPDAPPDDDFRRFCRRCWARLICKVYLTNPLACPQCGGRLRIIGFIDNPSIIEKILRHLKLWDLPERSPRLGRPATVEPGPDFLEWVAAARHVDGID